MRKKILNLFFIVVCLFSFSSCSQETSPKTKELIEKNIDARGGYEKLNAVKSLKITAKYMQQGRETELILMIKRPNFLYSEVRFPNGPLICGYDGKTTWWFHEARGHTKPQKLPAGQDLIISRYVEFDDLFMNYKKKGQKIEFVGTEYPDGKKVHKLKITLEHDIIRFV
jgi:outer membrane lipoprotein-sorting protein